MKKSHIHFGLGIFAFALMVSFVSQASARHFISSNARTVKVEYIPTVSAFGTITNAGESIMGYLQVPAPHAIFDGGWGDPDDSTGGDTLGGPRDTSHHCGGGHHGPGDTTGFGLDTNDFGFGFGDRDSSDGDTSHHCGGGDTSGFFGDRGDGNDTIECGGHHHDNDDTTTTNDTTLHTLFGSGSTSIVVKSHGQKATVNFVFKNNLSTSVKITNMMLASGRNFSIVSGAPSIMKPATLQAGARMTLKIAFNASDNAVHSDQLVVLSNSAQAVNAISLQGQVAAAASVSNSLPAGVTITAMPNPMTAYLKFDLAGVTSALVAIYDIRGNSVFTSSLSSSEWIWNGQATNGSILPAGSYMVRVSGVSSANQTFVSTEKIILSR